MAQGQVVPKIGEDVTALMGSAGNIDLSAQPKVKNPNGSVSTVDSRSFNIDGKEVLLPSVTPDGRHLQTNAAILAEYKQTGRHLGKFPDVASANVAAARLHEDYAAGKYDRPSGSAPPIGADVSHLMNPPAAPEPPDPNVDAHGNRTVRNPDGSVKFIQGPGYRGTTEDRPDSNIATIGGVGIAPETALMGMQAGRAMLNPALSAAGKVKAGLGSLAPLAKYEIAKQVLTTMHVPEPAAVLLAAAISGYKRGAAAPESTAAEPVTARPTAAPPAAEPPPSLAPDGRPWGTPKPTVTVDDVRARFNQSAPAPAPVDIAPARAAAFNPNAALQAAKDAFKAAGETPRPAEASNAMELIRRGKSPTDAVANIISRRPPLSPAEAFNAKFGTLTDAERDAALDARNARGEIKSPSAATARARKNVTASPATTTSWTPAKGGELFHGTTDQRIGQFGDQSAIYMTDNAAEAQGYAKGVHAPGESRGTPVVSKVSAKPGKTVDISENIMHAMNDDTFDHDWLDRAINDARTSGAHYVTYEHPSNLAGDQMQRVIVSLHPKADLAIRLPKVKP